MNLIQNGFESVKIDSDVAAWRGAVMGMIEDYEDITRDMEIMQADPVLVYAMKHTIKKLKNLIRDSMMDEIVFDAMENQIHNVEGEITGYDER